MGAKALLIDTDGQGNCASMLGVQPQSGLAELLMDQDSDPAIEARENLDLLAGSNRLALAQREIGRRQYDSQYVLAEALKPIEYRYDIVVIDTAPSYGDLSINVFFYGTDIIAPVNMEVLAARGFNDMLSELMPIAQRSGIRIHSILPTIADGRKGLTDDIIEQLKAGFGASVEEPIPYVARFSELPDKGMTIYEAAPRSRGAQAYAALARRVFDNGKTNEAE
jgi:chromosome partitioning protein